MRKTFELQDVLGPPMCCGWSEISNMRALPASARGKAFLDQDVLVLPSSALRMLVKADGHDATYDTRMQC